MNLRSKQLPALRGFSSTFWLILKIYFRQPIGIVLSFLSPTLITLIQPYLFNGIANIGPTEVPLKDTLDQLVPGLLMMPTLILGVVGVTITLSAIKETNLLKRFNSLSISPFVFFITFITVFVVIIIAATLWLFAFMKMIWQDDCPNPSSAAILLPWLMTMISSLVIGILMGNFSNSVMTGFSISMSSFLPIMFLSGIMFVQMQGWIEGVAKVVPQNSLLNLFKVAWYEGNLDIHNFSMPSGQKIDIAFFGSQTSDTLFAYLYPLCLAGLQSILIVKKFRWE